jgi:uroporphyrinogen-III synthase
LQSHGPVHWQPKPPYNSEALLELLPESQVKQKRIVIFKGEGGRTLLRQTLTARGAEVHEAPCYRRILPALDRHHLKKILQRRQIHVIIATSNTTLTNLMTLLGKNNQALIKHLPVIAFSCRINNELTRFNFHKAPIITAKASNAAIIQTLIQWQQGGHDERPR